jgi:hypothetical protein
VILIAALVAVAFALNSRTLRAIVPSESLLAFGMVFVVLMVLFQTGNLE